MPPKRKLLIDEQRVSLSRPQRNTKAKIVFDPSDVHIPKKRKKNSDKCMKVKNSKKYEKSIKNNVHITINHTNGTTNELVEELDDFSLNNTACVSLSSERSQSDSPERYSTPEIFQEELTICCMCTKDTFNQESVSCPICMIKAHSDCLVANEPMWRFKIDSCPWLCKPCREKYCSKCCTVESQMSKFYCCITCSLSFHVECYESYDTKPLYKLKSNVYVCIPCMTLATQRVPEVEDEEMFDTHSTSSSDNIDEGKASIKSYCSSIASPQNYTKKYCDQTNQDDYTIPDVSNWDKFQIFHYLSDRGLSQVVTEKIINNEIDGNTILLLQRSDIIASLGLKLGPALKFYKEVRILQTKSKSYSVCWE